MIETTRDKIILIIAIALFFIFCAMFGCQSSPERGNYNCEECFVAADVLYRNQKNIDKSVAMPLVEACRDAMKEQRRIQRLEYCTKTRPADMTFRECISWVNEK